jgi:hypothetical protein
MPKRVDFPLTDDKWRFSGITIEWFKTSQRLDIYGYYDTYVGIEGGSLTLRQFFDLFGITEKDCAKAFREEK